MMKNYIFLLAIITSVSFFVMLYEQNSFAQANNDSFTFSNGAIVEYSIENGRVSNMVIYQDTNSLRIDISAYGNGELFLSIPRSILDARLGTDGMSGEDDIFFVLVDGVEVGFEETTTSEDRTLTIPFEDGTTQIEIIGTQVLTVSYQANQQNYDTTSYAYYVYAYELPQWANYAVDVVYHSTKAWQDANPGLKFYQADSPEQSNLRIQWVKEFGVEHVGYAYGSQFIEVGLGDSNCKGTWQPYSANHVNWIMMHEIGHILGHKHSSDPNSIMYPTAPRPQYDLVEEEFTLAEGYIQFIPFCSSQSTTSFGYSISTDDPTYGFDVYVVPSIDEFNRAVEGKSFNYYSGNGCFGENYLDYGGTCEGIDETSGLLIVVDNRQTNKLTKLAVKQQEIVPFSGDSLQHASSTIVSYSYPDSYETNQEAVFDAFSIAEKKSKDVFSYFNVEKGATEPKIIEPELSGEEPSIPQDEIFFQKSNFLAGDTIKIYPLIWMDENRDKELVIDVYNSKNQLFKSYKVDENNVKNIYMALEGKDLVDGIWVAKLFDSNTLVDETTFSVEGTTEFLEIKSESIKCGEGTVLKDGVCVTAKQEETSNSKGSGCLIATATFGTELAPQVQMLREMRDNVLFSTTTGTAFMAGFNEFYYAFSPAVADLERKSPLFKEIVKTTITPMLSTMSILNYANIDSEQEMLGYGIGVILLNIGMYFVAPAVIIVKLRQKFRKA
jgi:hypothetical protein